MNWPVRTDGSISTPPPIPLQPTVVGVGGGGGDGGGVVVVMVVVWWWGRGVFVFFRI